MHCSTIWWKHISGLPPNQPQFQIQCSTVHAWFAKLDFLVRQSQQYWWRLCTQWLQLHLHIDKSLYFILLALTRIHKNFSKCLTLQTCLDTQRGTEQQRSLEITTMEKLNWSGCSSLGHDIWLELVKLNFNPTWIYRICTLLIRASELLLQ